MKILQVLKKYSLAIVAVIILLFIQAMCDLSLPDYTASIVNVGIQQNGIEDTVPKVITEKDLNTVLFFTDKPNNILDNYKLITKGNEKYLKEYPCLKNENIYILKDDVNINKLEKNIQIPYLITKSLNSDEVRNEMFKGVDKNIDTVDLLKSLDSNTLNKIKEEYSKKLEKFDSSLLSQMLVSSLKSDYKNIGIDVNKIQTNYIIITGIKMLSLALLAMILAVLVTYIASYIASSFSRDLRKMVVNKVMDFSQTEFKEFGISSLITRSTNDIQQIQMFIVMLLRIVIYAPIIGLGALRKVSGNEMSWIIGLAVLVILSLVIILFAIALPKFKIFQKLIDKLNLVTRETLTGLPVIRAFANEKHEEKRFARANKDLTKTSLFVNRMMTIMMPTMMFVMNGVSVLIIWVGSSKVDSGSIQVGTLIAFITYTMQIIMSFLMISMVSIMIPRAGVSLKRINEILKKDIVVKDKDNLKELTDIKGKIEFQDVYFRYPDALEDVLQDINLKIEPGTTTAFIGSTGSGKSTLINLIPRFFDVTGGKILIDGVDIKDISLKQLRSCIGYVPQKGVLFSGTIKSNIAFGKKLSKEELEEAAEISQSMEFILEKQNKFDTAISQGGNNVSGGQKQRLSIARAIAIKPKILVFDDSFSALDYKTDVKLRNAIKDKVKNSTVLIVAQRVGTVMHADQIVVLDKGHVVKVGKHKELMKNCEIYKQIALSQLSKEELLNEE